VLDGDPAPLPKKGAEHPQFLAHFYCGQTAGCIKMPLGMEVGLNPGDFVFDEDPATPREKGTPTPPNFCPCLLWRNGWMDEDATWYGSRPRPTQLCIRRVSSYPRKGHSSTPLFSAHVYCGRGRPSQLLLRSSWITQSRAYCRIYSGYTEAGAVAYLNNIPVPKLKCRSLSVR